jgi:hypothetical protein
LKQIKHLLTQQILTTILEKKDEAFKSLDVESFHVYNFLKEEFYKTNDIRENCLFQFTYRSFYGLDNAELTKEFKNRYFELMQEYRTTSIDLKEICIDLYNYRTQDGLNRVQFSFATKLANTIDDSYPIYDSEVAKVFNFNQPYYLKDRNLEIDKYLEQYDYIKHVSSQLSANENIKEIFLEMDDLYGVSCKSISNIKKLDFLVWRVGGLF